jgi:DNA-binding transcriptional regulator YiaG
MPNIMTALKAEIVRLARKEVKAATDPIRKPANVTRLTLADLKRRVAALEKQLKQADARLAKIPQPVPEEAPAKAKGWISGKGVRSLRQKLGLSQEAFAKLVGVSPNGVYQWEAKPGMLRLREKTRAAVFAARELGAREAKAKLAEMASAKKAKPAGKPKK